MPQPRERACNPFKDQGTQMWSYTQYQIKHCSVRLETMGTFGTVARAAGEGNCSSNMDRKR